MGPEPKHQVSLRLHDLNGHCYHKFPNLATFAEHLISLQTKAADSSSQTVCWQFLSPQPLISRLALSTLVHHTLLSFDGRRACSGAPLNTLLCSPHIRYTPVSADFYPVRDSREHIALESSIAIRGVRQASIWGLQAIQDLYEEHCGST